MVDSDLKLRKGEGVVLFCLPGRLLSFCNFFIFLIQNRGGRGGEGGGPSCRSATGSIEITTPILLCKFMGVLVIQNSAAGPEKSNRCFDINSVQELALFWKKNLLIKDQINTS